MISTTGTLYCLLALAVTAQLLSSRANRSRKLPLPPGPEGYPIIGNVHDMPHRYPWLTYAKWKYTYGPVFSFTVFGRTTIVINSLKAATDLLDKRSSNYSSRPRMVMADELLGWDWNFAHMPYNERWRRHRRIFHQYFQQRNLGIFDHFQKKMAITLLDQLSVSPNDFLSHIGQYVGSVVLHATYGYEVKSDSDFYVRSVKRAIEPLLHTVHANGSFLVEFIPALKHIPGWFPGAGFKRHVKAASQKVQELRDIPFESVKALMADGQASRSFVSDNLEKIKSSSPNSVIDEETLRNSAAIVYLGGSDSSLSLITAWILAMTLYPEIQKRAQEEVDQITGGTRLPETTDIGFLPYFEAAFLETLRWHSIAPLGVPHQAVHEDEYNGYRIPAGTTVTVNTWAILHDEDVYPEPFKFNPDRFLRNGKINFDSQPDPTLAGAFGYGRRICPGRYLAMQTTRLAILSILATYDINDNANGLKGVPPPMEDILKATDGVVSHPELFEAYISPRSANSIRLIESAKIAIS